MKYTMLFAALWWPYWIAAQITYNFIAGTGIWNDPSSWSPMRSNPKPDDIIQFSADCTVSGIPVSETIGALKIKNGAQVKLSAPLPANLLIGNSSPSPQFSIEAGSLLELNGTIDIHITLVKGTSGIVNGNMRVSGAPHRIEIIDSAGLKFESGSSFTAAPGFTGNAFGTTNLNSIVFKTGSSYFSQDGGNPFGAAAPSSVVIFESGSFFYQQQAIGLSLGGRTYGNLQTEANINLSLFGSINDVVIQNDFVVSMGYFIFHPNTLHAGNFKVFGSIVQRGSSILDIGNSNMTGAVQILGSNPEIGAGNGTGPCSFQNLFLNCDGSATLKRNVLVKGTIGLLKGNLITDTTNLLTLAAGASVASPMNLYGHTNEGWEESFVDGPVQLNIASTNKKVIPVGDAGIFAPITIEKANSNPASYVAQYFHQAFSDIFSVSSPPLDHVSHVEYWKLSCDDAANDAKINLSWRPGSFVGATIMERNDLALAHYVDFGFGTAWNQEGNQSNVTGDENYGYLGSDNYITSFSEFTLASISKFNVLPVNDIAFSARETAGIVTLKWNPNAQWKYYLSRGQTPGNYNFLKLIPLQTGIYHDTLPESGEFFYRLMLVDQHGGTIFSPTVRISFKEDCVFSLYPNPCRDILFINFSTPSSIGTLDLVNSQGQTLQTLSLAGRAINTIWLNKGKYYIRYRVKNKVVTKAFIRL